MIKCIIFCTKNIPAIGAHASASSLIIITYGNHKFTEFSLALSSIDS